MRKLRTISRVVFIIITVLFAIPAIISLVIPPDSVAIAMVWIVSAASFVGVITTWQFEGK